MDVLARVVLPPVSALPEDNVLIDLAFSGDFTTGTWPGGATRDAIADFFNTSTGGSLQPALLLSEDVSRDTNAAEVRLYEITDLSGATPLGSPFYSDSWTVGAISGGASGPLPSEVATVSSFKADDPGVPETAPNPTPPPATIRPAARYRGRIFVGPWDAGVIDNANPSSARPAESVLAGLRDGAVAFLGVALAAEDVTWGVWSRSDEIVRPVFTVSTDNAFDTVRSRGVAPTYRNVDAV